MALKIVFWNPAKEVVVAGYEKNGELRAGDEKLPAILSGESITRLEKVLLQASETDGQMEKIVERWWGE